MNHAWKTNLGGHPIQRADPAFHLADVILVIGSILAWVTIKGLWPYVWREWITSVDHKRIGVMYILLGLVMLLRGFSDALLMRTHLAFAAGPGHGYLPSDHYDQIFSAHGAIMIFFVAMPLVVGLMNFVVPLQLGVRDVAFPRLNSVSFWLTATGVLLINLSLFIGEFARTGWLVYPPVERTAVLARVGVDYYLWAIQIAGIGTLLGAVNLVTTILKLRAPGMSYGRMPVFCWTALASNLTILAAFPVLTATLALLTLDRYPRISLLHQRWRRQRDDVREPDLDLGSSGGLYPGATRLRDLFRSRLDLLEQAAVWLSHHGDRDDGDLRTVLHGMAAPLLHHGGQRQCKCLFWHHDHDHCCADRGQDLQLAVHHVRRSGALLGADAVGRGLHGHFRHRGDDGRTAGRAAVDFQLHNSLFLVAHFHNVIIGGVVFGIFAGYTYWSRKPSGSACMRGSARPLSGAGSSASISHSSRFTPWG